MNAYTTIEESKQLIETGLDVNTADLLYECFKDEASGDITYSLDFVCNWQSAYPNESIFKDVDIFIPCWSLSTLLNIIDSNGLIYDICNDKNREFEILVYEANYISQEVKFHHTEHSIVDMIIWLLESNYIKSNKNE